jgi:hypothetical protein
MVKIVASLARDFNAPERRLRNRLTCAPSKLQNKVDERLSESQDLAASRTDPYGY